MNANQQRVHYIARCSWESSNERLPAVGGFFGYGQEGTAWRGKKSNRSVPEQREGVLRMLRREEPGAVRARREGVSESALYPWRDLFRQGGEAALGLGKGGSDPQSRQFQELRRDVAERDRVIGERTIANRILKKRRAARMERNGETSRQERAGRKPAGHGGSKAWASLRLVGIGTGSLRGTGSDPVRRGATGQLFDIASVVAHESVQTQIFARSARPGTGKTTPRPFFSKPLNRIPGLRDDSKYASRPK